MPREAEDFDENISQDQLEENVEDEANALENGNENQTAEQDVWTFGWGDYPHNHPDSHFQWYVSYEIPRRDSGEQ